MTSCARSRAPSLTTPAPLQGGDIRPGDSAVNQEGAGGDEGGVVASEERHRGGDLLRLGETADRDVNEPASSALWVLGEQLLQQRGVHRPGAKRVHPDPFARELHAELP